MLEWVKTHFVWKDREDNVDGLIRSYANGLYVSARGLSAAPNDPFDHIAARLTDELAKPSLDFREIMAIENTLSRLYPPDVRRRRYWAYRQRFERVATASQLAAYLASNPPPPPLAPDPAAPGPWPLPPVYDADDLVLLEHIHRNYLITLLREQAVRDLKRWIQAGLARGLLMFGIVIGSLIWATSRGWVGEEVQYFGIGLVLLYLIGRLGAAMSVIQRLQKAVRDPSSDPIFEVTAICTGRRGISISMMSGGVFAILVYVIFGAGLGQHLGMSGGFFPQVQVDSPADQFPEAGAGTANPAAEGRAVPTSPAQPKGGASARSVAAPAALANRAPTAAPSAVAPPTPWQARCKKTANCMPGFVSEIGKHLGFREYPDFFKMLILAFLAGFAERFVPDALDRLVTKGKKDPANAANAINAGP